MNNMYLVVDIIFQYSPQTFNDMKTKFLFLLAGAYSLALLTSSCCEDDDLSGTTVSAHAGNEDWEKGYVYPLAEGFGNRPVTRSTSFETDWENETFVTTASGQRVRVPWAPDYTSTEMPVEIAKDVKKADGWKLIFHTFTSEADAYLNYLIFHNQLTGLLKIFYYSEGQTLGSNNGIWELEFQNCTQRMLNFTDAIADPLTYGSDRKHVYLTNITSNQSKGFVSGWNCCQTELAYDPGFTGGYLRIGGHNLQTTVVDVSGQYNSVSNGLIISESTTNPLNAGIKGAANLAGQSAEDWIKQKVSDGKIVDPEPATRSIGGLLAGIAGEGVKFIVNKGLHKVFSSFIGKFDRTSTTTQKLQLRTEGSISLAGTLVATNSSVVKGITIDFSPNKVGRVGAWSLADSPTLYFHPLGDFTMENYMGPSGEYTYRFRGMTKSDYTINVNPDLQSHLVRKWATVEVISYSWKNVPQIPHEATFDFGSIGGAKGSANISQTLKSENLLYGRYLVDGSIYTADLTPGVYTRINPGEVNGNPIAHAFIPKLITYEDHYFQKNNFVRLTTFFAVTINGKTDTIVNMKTFVPKMEWDPDLYNRFKNFSIQELNSYPYWT